MVNETLTREMVAAGRLLTAALDQATGSLVASFWLFETERGAWRLMFASPIVDQQGPTALYRLVQGALTSLPEDPDAPHALALDDVKVLSPRDRLVELLGKAMQTGPGIAGIRFTGNSINGHWIDDAYLYRVNPQPPARATSGAT